MSNKIQELYDQLIEEIDASTIRNLDRQNVTITLSQARKIANLLNDANFIFHIDREAAKQMRNLLWEKMD